MSPWWLHCLTILAENLHLYSICGWIPKIMSFLQDHMEIDVSAFSTSPMYVRTLTRFDDGTCVWSAMEKIDFQQVIKREKSKEIKEEATFNGDSRNVFRTGIKRKLDIPLIPNTEIKAEYPPDCFLFDESQSVVATTTLKSLHSPSECESIDSIETAFEDETHEGIGIVKQENWEPPELVIGEVYFACEKTIKDLFFKATLQRILKTERPSGKYEVLKTRTGNTLRISGRHLAYYKPPHGLLKVGTRVLAGFKLHKETGEMTKKKFQLGIVAELPSEENQHRYLVIFDIGYWLYVLPKDIRCIYYATRRVWKELDEPMASQVKEYLRDVEKEKLDFERGQRVEISQGENRHICNVITTDGSLVLVHYNAPLKPEWIYRGSKRILRVTY